MGGWLHQGISERLPSGGFTSRTALLSVVAMNRIQTRRRASRALKECRVVRPASPLSMDSVQAMKRMQVRGKEGRRRRPPASSQVWLSRLSNRQDPGTSPSPSPDGWRRMEKMGLRYVWSDFHPECFPIVSPMLDHPTEADWIVSDHVGAESTTCVCRSLQGEAQ
jgi:hypothetical protein